MASLRSYSKTKHIFRQINQQRHRFSTATVLSAEWNKNWMPGPYPKTPEERAAAAKKYGMRVQDYEPYPDNGWGWGDYPKLPPVGDFSKSNYENWDFPEAKRNYGEVLHIHADMYTEERFDPAPPKIPYWAGLSFSALFMASIIYIAYLVDHIDLGQKVLIYDIKFRGFGRLGLLWLTSMIMLLIFQRGFWRNSILITVYGFNVEKTPLKNPN